MIPLCQQGGTVSIDAEYTQLVCCVSAGVEIDAVMAEVNICHGRMAVHNDEPEISLKRQKIIPDPDEIIKALCGKGNTGPDPGMNKAIVSDTIIGEAVT